MRGRAGLGRGRQDSSVPCPGQPLSHQVRGPRRHRARGCSGQSCSPGLTRMARNTGKRRIHQKPMLLLVVQHLQRGGTGLLGSPLTGRLLEPRVASAAPAEQVPRPGTLLLAQGDGVKPLRGCHTIPTIPWCVPRAPACIPHTHPCPTHLQSPTCCRGWYSLDVFIEEFHNDPRDEEQHRCPWRGGGQGAGEGQRGTGSADRDGEPTHPHSPQPMHR